MRFRWWVVLQATVAVAIVLLTLRTLRLLRETSDRDEFTTTPPYAVTDVRWPRPPRPPVKPDHHGKDAAVWNPPPHNAVVAQPSVRPTQPPPNSAQRSKFVPQCDTLALCLMDYWLDFGGKNGAPRVVFMAGHARSHSCLFNGILSNSSVAVNAAEQGVASGTGYGAYACEVSEPPGGAQSVTIAGRTVPMPPAPPPREFELTAVIMFRIFREDLFNITFWELDEWFDAMRIAGVQHVYAYDNYLRPHESQESALAPRIRDGFVSYHHWPFRGFGYPLSQNSAYAHHIARYGRESEWCFQADVDEYPLVHQDTAPGYLRRLALDIAKAQPEVSQAQFQSVFYGPREEIQPPLRPREDCVGSCESRCRRAMLIERFHDRSPLEQTLRWKPLFKPRLMVSAAVHVYTGPGSVVQLPFSRAWLLHYWGFRCKNCNTPDKSAVPLALSLRKSLRDRDCAKLRIEA